MTDKKFTDEEIIKALEGSILNAKGCDSKVWSIEIYKLESAIDLINRQKSEIDRLKTENKIYIEANQVIGYQRDQRDKEIDELQKQIDGLDVRENKIKSEAYKEFAEKLENEINMRTSLSIEQDKNVIRIIHNLLKETVGEEKQEREGYKK